MRIILLSIAFLFLAFSAQSQVLKSAGVWYFLDVDSMTARPAVLPNGTELAYVVGTKTVYYWNRNTSTWTAYGSTFGRDSIYFDASIIGSGTVSDPWGVDSTLFATIAAVGDSIAAALLDYVKIVDTAAMLTNYPSTAGYGIIDAGKTWRADTTSPNGLATRLFSKTLPTSILTGQVAYSNGSNLVGSANHFWDNTNVRLGIGTNTPAFDLDIVKTSNAIAQLRVYNSNGGTGAHSYLTVQNSSSAFQLGKLSTTYAGYKTLVANDNMWYTSGGDISILSDGAGGKMKFAMGGSSTAQMTLSANGNLLLGTTTDVSTSILTARSTTKSSSPFPLHTLAESDAITGVQGNFDYETTQNGLRWHNGTRKAYALESTFARGTATRVPFFDANGQVTDDSGITYSAAGSLNILGSSVVHDYGLAITSAITTNSTGSIGGINIAPTLTYSSGSNPAAYGVNIDPTFSGSFGGGYAGLRITSKSQYSSYGSAMIVLKPSAVNGIYIEGTASRALIELIPTNSTSRALQVLNTSDNNYGSTVFLRASTTVGVGTGFRMAVNPSGTSDAAVNYEQGVVLTENAGSASRNAIVWRNTRSSAINERMRLTDIGYLGILTATPEQELHTVGDGYFTDSLRVGTLPNQTSATKILSSDASGWVGYRAFSDFASTWLKTELEASRDVTITGGSSTDFTIQNTRVQFDGKFKVGSDSTFYHDPSSNDTYAGGNFTTPYMHSNSTALYSDVGGIISRKTTYAANQGAYYSMSSQSSSGWLGGLYLSNILGTGLNFEAGYEIYRYAARERYAINHYVLDPKAATLETYLQTSLDTAIIPGSSWAFIRLGGNFNSIAKSLWFTSAGSASVDTAHFRFNNINGLGVATGKFFTVEDNSSPLFVIRKNGTTSLNTYGTGNKEASDLSKTQSNYIAGFATDGTVLDLERKRDTTIFLTADTDYNFSAAVTTAQIASRYNRIIIHMTLTSGVGADKTTTLHTPDANLMQCEILIRGTDNTGTYDNEIAFGTNNAISSDGTNTSGYTLAQGQGLHVRVVYNGSAYKYIYY